MLLTICKEVAGNVFVWLTDASLCSINIPCCMLKFCKVRRPVLRDYQQLSETVISLGFEYFLNVEYISGSSDLS